jgi:hypothetical protein
MHAQAKRERAVSLHYEGSGGLGFISLDTDVVVLPVAGSAYTLECRYEPAALPPGV